MSIVTDKSVTWRCDHCQFEEKFIVGTPGKDWIRVSVVVEEMTWDRVVWQVCSWECAAAIAGNERSRSEGFDPDIPGVMRPYVKGYRDSRQGDLEKSGSSSIRQ